MKNNKLKIISIHVFAYLLVSFSAFASGRLESVASNANAEITSIAQTCVGIGIVLGGLLMAIGATQVGKYVLMSGLMGALAVFGGPALIETVRSIAGH